MNGSEENSLVPRTAVQSGGETAASAVAAQAKAMIESAVRHGHEEPAQHGSGPSGLAQGVSPAIVRAQQVGALQQADRQRRRRPRHSVRGSRAPLHANVLAESIMVYSDAEKEIHRGHRD
jgi:hypothetical protein